MRGTILDNIVYGVETYSQEEVEEAVRIANLGFLKEREQFPLGLQTQVFEKSANLSGGQKQRIAIARAIIKKTKIIIFDEATSALDSYSEEIIQNSIDILLKKSSCTIIIIAHKLKLVQNCQ